MWSQSKLWKSWKVTSSYTAAVTTQSRSLPLCSDRQVISFCAQTMGNTYLHHKIAVKISPKMLQYATCLFIIMSLTFSTATDSNQSKNACECFIVMKNYCGRIIHTYPTPLLNLPMRIICTFLRINCTLKWYRDAFSVTELFSSHVWAGPAVLSLFSSLKQIDWTEIINRVKVRSRLIVPLSL